jgi:hypothetical protein
MVTERVQSNRHDGRNRLFSHLFRNGFSRRPVPVLLALLALVAVATVPLASGEAGATGASASVPVDPGHLLHVQANISELPVPPTVPTDGVCTDPSGCVSGVWGALGSPGFFWNSSYVLLGVTYAGAPSTGAASAFSGPQVLLVRTNGTTFADGNAWKCITCGADVAAGVVASDFTYPPPHALPGDRKVLVGNGILECTSPSGYPYVVSDPRCTPGNTHIYPIYWGDTPLGGTSASSPFGNGREWRLSPDGVHLAWDSLIVSGTSLSEDEFEGTLQFDPANQRYDLTHVYFLPQASPWVVEPGNKLKFEPRTMIGELRGWTSDGRSILGIQSYESDSIDAWATSLTTGKSEPLTDHAEYTDPMFMSPNGKWLIAEEVAGSGRLDFISGMEGIPTLTDQLPTTGYVSGIRNDLNRRFFLPWLVSPGRDKSEQINAGGDPNWNAAADPVWLANSTAVVWVENLACGANPAPHQCSDSTEPGGRNSRVMIARFPGLRPSKPHAPAPISNTAPARWAIAYTPGQTLPSTLPIPEGTYTVGGHVQGHASVVITDNSSGTAVQRIQATYDNFSQDRRHVINGTESVQNDSTPGDVTWNENLTLSGQETGTKVTSPGGFTLGTSVLISNNFQATGTMTTTIDGQTYTQPANGS